MSRPARSAKRMPSTSLELAAEDEVEELRRRFRRPLGRHCRVLRSCRFRQSRALTVDLANQINHLAKKRRIRGNQRRVDGFARVVAHFPAAEIGKARPGFVHQKIGSRKVPVPGIGLGDGDIDLAGGDQRDPVGEGMDVAGRRSSRPRRDRRWRSAGNWRNARPPALVLAPAARRAPSAKAPPPATAWKATAIAGPTSTAATGLPASTTASEIVHPCRRRGRRGCRRSDRRRRPARGRAARRRRRVSSDSQP